MGAYPIAQQQQRTGRGLDETLPPRTGDGEPRPPPLDQESRILIWLWDTISQRLDTDLPEDKRKDIKRIVQDQYDRYDWPGRPFTELRGVSYSLTLRPGVVPSYQPLRMLSPEQKLVVQNTYRNCWPQVLLRGLPLRGKGVWYW